MSNEKQPILGQYTPVINTPGAYPGPPPPQQPYQQQNPVIDGQPRPQSLPVGIAEFGKEQPKLVIPLKGHREWSSGKFDCGEDPTNCLMVFCCEPCVMCQLSTRMGECACMPLCGGLVAMRTRLRTLGGIQGSICKDYITLMCCRPCAVCQMKREMDDMGIYSV